LKPDNQEGLIGLYNRRSLEEVAYPEATGIPRSHRRKGEIILMADKQYDQKTSIFAKAVGGVSIRHHFA
jgi:hypothetical protein